MPVKQTQAAKATFERLYAVTIGALAAETEATQTTTRLDDGVAAEITHMAIRSPLDAVGEAEAVRWISLVIDDKEYDGGDLIKVRGDLDSLQMPPTEFFTGEKLLGSTQTRRKALQFGMGLPDLALAAKQGNPMVPLLNTTVKVKPGGKMAARIKIGNTATTDNTVVEFYGWRYSTVEILDKWIARIFGQAYGIVLQDVNADRQFLLSYPGKTGGSAIWGELPGGQDQRGLSSMQIRKFIRYSKNAIATTPNQRFELQSQNNNVNTEYQNLKFDIANDPKRLLAVVSIGVQPYTANMQQLFVKVNGQDIPHDGFRTSDTYNPLKFGRDTPTGAALEVFNHRFIPMPVVSTIFIHGETGKFELLDDGTAIPAGANFGTGVLVTTEIIEIISESLVNQ